MSNINIETLVREAVKAALAEVALTQQVTEQDTCTEVAASTGERCKRPATHGTVCGLHTPEKLGAPKKANTFFQDVIVPRASKREVNRKAAAIVAEFGFSRSGPEWAYVRDGLLQGKSEAVLRDTLKG